MASTLKVNTIQHTGGTTGLTIDSSGRVLQPNVVAWFVNKTSTQTASADNELIGRSYHFAPEIDGTVILSIKDKINLKNYIGKFVEANISFANEYDLYGEVIRIL